MKMKKIDGMQNADYLLPGAVLELKIIEEEGLEKKNRQDKIEKLLTDKYILPEIVDIGIKNVPSEIKKEYQNILGEEIVFKATIFLLSKLIERPM